LLHSTACFLVVYFAFVNLSGWIGIVLRSIIFIALFMTTAFYFNLSPDLKPVLGTIKKRLRIGN
jgi:hypothetical protein